MKKIILSLAFIASIITASAQEYNKFRIGFKFNPNVSWMRPDAKEISSNGTVFRFGFALNLDKHFTENYAFGTGLNIFQTGGELVYVEQTTVNSDVPVIIEKSRVYKLQYFEIPLTLKLRTNEVGYITYWGQFGLGLGFNIRAKADDEIDYLLSKGVLGWEETSLESFSEEDIDIKDGISIFRTSLIVGGGIEYNMSGTTSIIAGITFNNGFSDVLQKEGVKTDNADAPIFDSDNNPVEYKLKGITNHIELNIGILF
ncbi:MAG: porin family protein [Flavobacteriales bacterium]|nr:porin family protein [Flavobacteriales bacterium]